MLNPVICGIAAGVIVYLFVYVENKAQKKKQHIPETASIKLPILTASLVWVFCSLSRHTSAIPPMSTDPWND